MIKHDYTALDAAILNALSTDKPVGFAALQSGEVSREAHKLESAERSGFSVRTPAFRFIDRRLQALRKAGRIVYQRKPEGWLLTNP